MKRFTGAVFVLFAAASIGGCVSAKERAEEQRQLEKSIRVTSDPEAVRDCSFIMNLRPDGLHSTPQAQAASLVIPRPGVSWVVFGGPGGNRLYSCSQAVPPNEREAKAPVPTPVEAKPEARTPVPVEPKAVPTPSAAGPEVVATEQPKSKTEVSSPETKSVYKTRVTSNPEAVKGCKFLESFADYQKVSRFQEVVVGAGGNVGYIVATNQNGEVIGESYLCSEEPKP